MTITCLIADDQAIVRQGLSALLVTDPELIVVGQAADGIEAVDQTRSLEPDVVLMDVRMPNMDGLEATRQILAPPSTDDRPRVLMLTTFDVDQYVYEALHAGASGFLLKDTTAEELIHAVRVVAAGDCPARAVRDAPTDRHVRRPATTPGFARDSRLESLTPREKEVLHLIARGLSNSEISESLVIAEQTTKTHVGRILTKLQLRDRAQAVVLAYETGLVTPSRH